MVNMNTFLRLSMENSLQNNAQANIPSNFSGSSLSDSKVYSAINYYHRKPKLNEQKAFSELQDIFKNWYQNVIRNKTKDPELLSKHQLLSPALGITLLQISQQAQISLAHLRQLYDVFHYIVDYHRFLYQWHDKSNEGLITTLHHLHGKRVLVQDPLFNSLVTWSNECLIKIGHMLDEDLSEILEWYELTIHSMNVKLWNATKGLYEFQHQDTKAKVETPIHIGLSPLLGGIPTQEQAEAMVSVRSAELFHQTGIKWSKAINLAEYAHLNQMIGMNGMIQNALLRYGFTNLYEATNLLIEDRDDEMCNGGKKSKKGKFIRKKSGISDWEFELSTL